MREVDDLPSVDDALRTLPALQTGVRAVILEAVDAVRSRLSLTVPTGSMLDLALHGRSGWLREVEPTPRRPPTRRAPTRTYWCWVRADASPLTSANREEPLARLRRRPPPGRDP